jgi:predicted double-glycine peptidase
LCYNQQTLLKINFTKSSFLVFGASLSALYLAAFIPADVSHYTRPVAISSYTQIPLIKLSSELTPITEPGSVLVSDEINELQKKNKPKVTKSRSTLTKVPFYSQFSDISKPDWQKVGCGIASLAMLIELYEPGKVSVDNLLNEGIAAGAYLNNAGWIHQGLVNLAGKYGLSGGTHDLSGKSMDVAFDKLQDDLKEGPVIVSVHYTFDPNNPIPHLAVINGIKDGKVYYNDPAEKAGGGHLSIADFKKGWKKRYIEIRPTS